MGDPVLAEPGGIQNLPVGERPRGISIDDFNNDGRMDIAVANADSDTVTILLQGDDSGQFIRQDYDAGNEPSDIETGDFDRDGDMDAAIANHETSSVTVLLNDGVGRFSPAPGSPYETEAEPHLHGLAVGDFDDDGWLDIAADSSDTDAVVMLRGSSEGFTLVDPLVAGRFPYYRIDSLPTASGSDILVPSPRAHRVSRIAPRQVTAQQPALIGDAEGAMMVISANLNGDDRADVVAVMNGAVIMWAAEDSGFSVLPDMPVPFHTPTEIAAGDIDGDGRDEVVVGLWDDDSVHILSSEGTSLGSVRACYRPAALAVADLNGDARAEIAAGCWNDEKIMIFDAADNLLD